MLKGLEALAWTQTNQNQQEGPKHQTHFTGMSQWPLQPSAVVTAAMTDASPDILPKMS